MKHSGKGSGLLSLKLICAKGSGLSSLRVAPRDEEECQGVRIALLLEAALLCYESRFVLLSTSRSTLFPQHQHLQNTT